MKFKTASFQLSVLKLHTDFMLILYILLIKILFTHRTTEQCKIITMTICISHTKFIQICIRLCILYLLVFTSPSNKHRNWFMRNEINAASSIQVIRYLCLFYNYCTHIIVDNTTCCYSGSYHLPQHREFPGVLTVLLSYVLDYPEILLVLKTLHHIVTDDLSNVLLLLILLTT